MRAPGGQLALELGLLYQLKASRMHAIDLSDYNLAELKGLQLAVTLELRQRQLQEQRRAREQIGAIARALGLSVRDVLRR